MNNINRIVIESVASVAGCSVADITMETRLREDLDFDSLMALDLTMDLEEEFDIAIANDELLTMITVGDIIATVHKKLG